MKVILAEKPSVARDLAAFVQARQQHEGYLEGNGYQVTWAYGHLVELQEPGDYDPALKRWSLATLPFIPAEFRLKQTSDRRGHQQFHVIRQLFRCADEIICATDAGREGELIFRYILSLSGCEGKPVRRLWLSSLTHAAIREAFQRLRPGSDYDRLYAAARCRNQADWIVGINATRNYTVRHGQQGLLWSIGRVQTPVLALIVQRDDEIRTFRPEPFWELQTRYRDVQFKFRGERFSAEEPALELLHTVQGHPFTITGVRKKPSKVLPPQLYDLTELQRDLNRRFGMSAEGVLKAAQSLYEKKLITYPRTDSRYLGSDMRRQVPGILGNLHDYRPAEIGRLDLQRLRFSSRIINDKKVSDHHAIIPTGNVPRSLPSGEQRVFDAVVTRLIAAFYPPCRKEITTVDGESNAVPFRARGVRVIDPGWTELYPRSQSKQEEKEGEEGRGAQTEGTEEQQTLPEFRVGETGPHEPRVRRGETTPPRHFTENTLLAAMETAGKLVDDEQLKEALKERGLGTPATRAAIIETLLKRGYIERSKKQVLATDLGRYLIALVRNRDLKSPELTGQWEEKLRRIDAGTLPPERFMQDIESFAIQVIAADRDRGVDQERWGLCPRCGRDVIRGKRGYGCSGWRDGCGFVLWPTYQERPLDENQIRQLLQLGMLAEPFQMDSGRSVFLALTDSGQLVDIDQPDAKRQKSRRGERSARRTPQSRPRGAKPPRKGAGGSAGSIGKCPLCGADVVERNKAFGCNRWRDGCSFAVWKTIAGKRIGVRTARTLLAKHQTSVLKGFTSKSGKKFQARLKLVDGDVKFDFS